MTRIFFYHNSQEHSYSLLECLSTLERSLIRTVNAKNRVYGVRSNPDPQITHHSARLISSADIWNLLLLTLLVVN